MNKLFGVNLLGIKLKRDRFTLMIQKHHKFCIVNFDDPWLYDESRARIDGASLSNSFIVVTNKLDRFQPLRLNGQGARKSFFQNILYETKLISCSDNSKVAFNDETDVLFISALFPVSKLLLTEQLIGSAGSIITLTVSVKILKLINWMKTSLK